MSRTFVFKIGIALMVVVLCLIFVLCVYNGWILLNHPSQQKYPVRGVDVSSYQGKIDWQILQNQGDISFAYIKATEGSAYVDPRFAYNYAEAQKTVLRVGVYHFFSFDSAGKSQAEHFIHTVQKLEDMLPVVIDLELYADYQKDPPAPETVKKELNDMIDMLYAHYGAFPILYVTKESYTRYVMGDFPECDIWYRDVMRPISVPDGRHWTFWQYTNRERLQGYDGKERFIDMNVFYGTTEEFLSYGK